MRPARVVALCGSAGSLTTMLAIVRRLRAGDHAAVFVVYHRGPAPPFPWDERLLASSGFSAQVALDGEPVRANVLYHADDGDTIRVRDGAIALDKTSPPPRPNLDALLASLADEFQAEVVAFLLSGTGRDAIDGLERVRRAGGHVVVQHPHSALFPQLPQRALDRGVASLVEPTDRLVDLASRAAAGEAIVV
jgi:chemotaxis response regulator CheB